MSVQVITLMWMRTTVMYQYRYGSTTSEALRALYQQGGVRRFYRGVLPALFQAPLSRFGDVRAPELKARPAQSSTNSKLDGVDSFADRCQHRRDVATQRARINTRAADRRQNICLSRDRHALADHAHAT